MQNDIEIEDFVTTRFGHSITLMQQASGKNEHRIVMFGGAVGWKDFVITNEIYVFNHRKKKWTDMVVDFTTGFPSPRAAHAAAAVDSRHIAVFGGARAQGQLVDNELYILSVHGKHCRGTRVPCQSARPPQLYGHSLTFMSARLVLFGGSLGYSLSNELWVLHMTGEPHMWMRVVPQSPGPCPRVYHSATAWKSPLQNDFLLVFGGKTGKDSACSELWGLKQTGPGSWQWLRAPDKAVDGHSKPGPRSQHASICVGSLLVITGGKNLRGDLLKTEVFDIASDRWFQLPPVGRYRHQVYVRNNALFSHGGFNAINGAVPATRTSQLNLYDSLGALPWVLRNLSSVELADEHALKGPEFRLSGKFFAVKISNDVTDRRMIRQYPIGNLRVESTRLKSNCRRARADPEQPPTEANALIARLLLNCDWDITPIPARFDIDRAVIHSICDAVVEVLEEEPSLLRLRPGVKIFGSLHGRFRDLLRLFKNFGVPEVHHASESRSDLEAVDYLFLGNYVDHGPHSLEIVLLLFSLKLKFPRQVHLLRGSHECKTVNYTGGLGQECRARLGEDPLGRESVFNKINRVFNFLPFAALLGGDILCVPSGIGNSLFSLADVQSLARPFVFDPAFLFCSEQKLVHDLLCSQPALCGRVTSPSAAENSLGKFGPRTIEQFKQKNQLRLILSSNRVVRENAFEYFDTKFFSIWSNFGFQEPDRSQATIMHNQKCNNTFEIKKLDCARKGPVSVQARSQESDSAKGAFSERFELSASKIKYDLL